MAEVFTEHTSWGGRIGQSFGGVIIGFILFVAAFPLLFWNEGRAIRDAKRLDEGSKAVLSVPAEKVDPANEGKEIHISGDAKTADLLADPPFGVSINALALRRSVEMFQWKESSHEHTTTGGGKDTSYSYEKGWSSSKINSGSFHNHTTHEGEPMENPTSWPYEPRSWWATNVNIGAFKLSDELIQLISAQESLPATQSSAATAPAGELKVTGESYFVGDNLAHPEVGDMRVSFKVTRPEVLSVVAQQSGNSFVPFPTKFGDVRLLQTGAHTAEEMFKKAKADAAMMTWILRLVGFVIMAIGISLVLKPLTVLAGFLPFLEQLAGMATGLVAFMGAFVLSLITIAIAWVFYRPLVGILLLAAAGAGAFLLMRARRPVQAVAGGVAVPAPGGPPPLR